MFGAGFPEAIRRNVNHLEGVDQYVKQVSAADETVDMLRLKEVMDKQVDPEAYLQSVYSENGLWRC